MFSEFQSTVSCFYAAAEVFFALQGCCAWIFPEGDVH